MFGLEGLPALWLLLLGVVGLVVGPVVLALARELWEQRVSTAEGSPPGR